MSNGKYRKESNCLNCGFQVEKHYCSSCGQPNLDLKENLWDFLSHSIAHYFHFDNKFFQTLAPLLTKPGKVTQDYLAGKRARYINPVSMYIFVSIVYFIVCYAPPKKKKESKAESQAEIVATRKELLNDRITEPLADVVGEEDAQKASQQINESVDRETFRIMSFTEQDSVLKSLNAQYQLKKSDSLAKLLKKLTVIHAKRNDSTYAAYLARQNSLPADEKDSFLERMMAKRSIGIGEKSEVIEEKLAHNRPKQYFLLMPLMALFIMLNFRKNHINYLDHLIFTIHGMTVFFLISIFTKPLTLYVFDSNSFISQIINLALVAFVLWYMFNSLKVFYQRKNGAIIGKMIWIIILYGISFGLTESFLRNVIYYMGT